MPSGAAVVPRGSAAPPGPVGAAPAREVDGGAGRGAGQRRGTRVEPWRGTMPARPVDGWGRPKVVKAVRVGRGRGCCR